MPTRYTGRVLTIVAVLYISICCIYPRAPFSFFQLLLREPISMQHNLRPGIDMAGGTSLLYEIESDGETAPPSDLAQQVATALKKRVDPQGVRNLIWRPQGATRLEVQLPLSRTSDEATAARDEFVAAQEKLESLIVKPQQVIAAVEQLDGETRDARLAELASGNATRTDVYGELVSAFDALKQAQESGTIIEASAKRDAYDEAKQKLDRLNVSMLDVNAAVSATGDLRQQRIDGLLMASENFPERKAAIEEFVASYDAYEKVRDEIADTASLIRLLQGSGVLSFHIRATQADLGVQGYEEMYERLMRVGPRPQAGDETRWLEVDRPDILTFEAENGETIDQAVRGPDGKRYTLVWITDDKSVDERDKEHGSEWSLQEAKNGSDQNGLRAVAFTFDAQGAALFGDLTRQNIGAPLTTVLDDRVVSVANINGPISKNGIITGGRGGFSVPEQEYLVSTFNAGALPARLSDEPLSVRTVGPQLGADNLRAGLIASIFGVLIVGVFLISYYYMAGFVAFLAVVMNMLIILASMAALGAPFTLAGIAGIILSLGMSVDANVLIFERLREEQNRNLSLRMALRNAYDRAFSAIMDSNITTGITALVLYWVGSEEVRGFGLTLLIGIFASLFTALFVTRTIFGLMIDKLNWKDLGSLPRSVKKLDQWLTPNWDWMGKAWLLGGISAIIVTIGCVMFGYYWQKGRILDIEFAGGTTAQFELVEEVPLGELRDLLETDDMTAGNPLADAQLVTIESATGGGSGQQLVWELVANAQDKDAVQRAIVQRLGNRLNLQEAADFTGSNVSYDEAAGTTILPITGQDMTVDGLAVDQDKLLANDGGAIIVLRDLKPMLEDADLRARINQERLKGQFEGAGLRGGVSIDVQTFPAQEAAVVLLSNAAYGYDEGNLEVNDDWRRQLAEPFWKLTNAAVTEPDDLQKLTNIDSQVAAEFSRNAVLAVVLSVLAIMVYIRVRFGDLKYSTATIVALAHDTLFCLAGIGYAHFLSHTFIGDALLIDPFRLNLTMVAAILTVMGFSMNDTVVVFDRIRENRGKYGDLDRKVVNDSINQTLSRTLLTGGTTLVTIAVMYFTGGPGIHGFTFAMLVGIITGTYSSIAIASPLLLVGKAVLGDDDPTDEDESSDTAMAAT